MGNDHGRVQSGKIGQVDSGGDVPFEALRARSKVFRVLQDDLGASPELAVKLVHENGEEEESAVRDLARLVSSKLAATRSKEDNRSACTRTLTSKLARIKHGDAVKKLLELGFPESDTIQALRIAKYDYLAAVKELLKKYLNVVKSLSQQAPIQTLSEDAVQTSSPLPSNPQPPLSTSTEPPPPPKPSAQPPSAFISRAAYNASMLQIMSRYTTSELQSPEALRAARALRTNIKSARARLAASKQSASTQQHTEGGISSPSQPVSSSDGGSGGSSEENEHKNSAHREPTDIQRLRERLQNNGLKELVMQGDGNCQFRSVAYELYGSQAFHEHVRLKAVRYIRDNSEQFAPYFASKDELGDYIIEMSCLGCWGDELTLRAIAEAYGVEVHVLTSTEGFGCTYLTYSSQKQQTPLPPEAPHVFMTYLNPTHYNVCKLEKDPLREHVSSEGKELLKSCF